MLLNWWGRTSCTPAATWNGKGGGGGRIQTQAVAKFEEKQGTYVSVEQTGDEGGQAARLHDAVMTVLARRRPMGGTGTQGHSENC